jgi:hypothetical protein
MGSSYSKTDFSQETKLSIPYALDSIEFYLTKYNFTISTLIGLGSLAIIYKAYFPSSKAKEVPLESKVSVSWDDIVSFFFFNFSRLAQKKQKKL